MKRPLAFAAAAFVLECGSPPATTTTVPIPLATSDASAATHVVIDQRPAVSLVAYYHMCLLTNGQLRCRDVMNETVPFSKEPIVPGLEKMDVNQASIGRDFSCAVLRSGDLACWGGNHFGQLGAGLRDANHTAPIAVPNLHGVKSVFAGPEHVCATLEGGRVTCWGKNQFGENGSSTQYLEAARELVEPHVVPGVDGVVDMALGWDATYAATSNGVVIAWGKKKLKDDPTQTWSEEPRAIASLEGTTSLTSTEETFCGVRHDKLICWGQTSMITPGFNRDELVTIPVEHPTRVRIASMHGCAIDAAGAVWCFGTNTEGELGLPPASGTDRYTAMAPVKVPGIPRVTDVICASAMTCAVTVSNEVWCWGRFTYENETIHPPTRMPL